MSEEKPFLNRKKIIENEQKIAELEKRIEALNSSTLQERIEWNNRIEKLEGFVYNQSDDKWNIIKKLESVMVKLIKLIITDFLVMDLESLDEYREEKEVYDDLLKQLDGEKQSEPYKFKKNIIGYMQDIAQLESDIEYKDRENMELLDKIEYFRKECNDNANLIDEFLENIEWMRQVYENDYTWANMNSMIWIRWLQKWEKRRAEK